MPQIESLMWTCQKSTAYINSNQSGNIKKAVRAKTLSYKHATCFCLFVCFSVCLFLCLSVCLSKYAKCCIEVLFHSFLFVYFLVGVVFFFPAMCACFPLFSRWLEIINVHRAMIQKWFHSMHVNFSGNFAFFGLIAYWRANIMTILGSKNNKFSTRSSKL